jgi:hypothetical protein
MESSSSPFDFLNRLFPGGSSPLGQYGPWIILGGGILILLLFLLLLSRVFRRKPDRDPKEQPREDLSEYPPAPPAPGAPRAHIENLPARLRLVVVAPIGRDKEVHEAALPAFLNQLVRGLGDVYATDRPRVKIWPSPLSVRAFAPTFHRTVVKPELEGQPSPWVLAAGVTKIGSGQMLLGLAFYADQPNTLGRLTLDPNDWRMVLRVGEG